jgi:hypothetical protein
MFVVTAIGPNGVFWLSEPSEIGLRTLVSRDQAEVFPTHDAAERAIQEMPTGYKFARVSFATTLAGVSYAARADKSAQPMWHLSDEPKTKIGDLQDAQPNEPETISDAASWTVADVPCSGPKASKNWLSWAALARLWQR